MNIFGAKSATIDAIFPKRKEYIKVPQSMRNALSNLSSFVTAVISPMATCERVFTVKYKAWI